MRTVAIIPARMAATRFPDKPLAKICGMPMIGHVYHRTKMCESLTDTYVATCDQEIARYVESIGGKYVMTSSAHERCTDRTAEAMTLVEQASGQAIDVVAMVQGDEPMLDPSMIAECIDGFSDANARVVNLIARIRTDEELQDPNTVKVVFSRTNQAIYFSRSAIPFSVKNESISRFKQLGMIGFRRNALLNFASLPPTPLERIESIDMLRLLESGSTIRVVETQRYSRGVDTPQDLEAVSLLMDADPLRRRYS